MNLDINTLFFMTIYVEAILGLLLLFAWIQNAGIRAVAWWGCAHLVRATSVVLFGVSGFAVGTISIDLARASCSWPMPSPGPARACSMGASPCRCG